jgi:hypothetical protein
MNTTNIFSGTIGVIIVLIILYCLYKDKVSKMSERLASGVGGRVDGWMNSGGYLNYYMT